MIDELTCNASIAVNTMYIMFIICCLGVSFPPAISYLSLYCCKDKDRSLRFGRRLFWNEIYA